MAGSSRCFLNRTLHLENDNMRDVNESEEIPTDFEIDDSSIDVWAEDVVEESYVWKMKATGVSESDRSFLEEIRKNFKLDGSSLQLIMEGTERLTETVVVSMQSGDNGVILEAEFQLTAKKRGAKEKGKKSAKLNVLGSAKR
ncbi:hypothetical protein ACFE04_021602 [Oxalis oulophora]